MRLFMLPALTLLGAALCPVSAQTAPAAGTAKGSGLAVTNRAVSALSIEVGAVAKGRIVTCPAALKLSASAVCLYAQSPAATLRPLIRGKLATHISGDWKTTAKSSVLLVKDAPAGNVAAFVMLSALAEKETLVIMDATQLSAAKTAVPTGVVRGQPYVLGSDLVGVVKVTSLGSGKYRLSSDDQGNLTVTVGQRAAQTDDGAVELPLAPVTDGRNLIFPLAGLRALGCTTTPAAGVITVACGSDSVGLKPIVF